MRSIIAAFAYKPVSNKAKALLTGGMALDKRGKKMSKAFVMKERILGNQKTRRQASDAVANLTPKYESRFIERIREGVKRGKRMSSGTASLEDRKYRKAGKTMTKAFEFLDREVGR